MSAAGVLIEARDLSHRYGRRAVLDRLEFQFTAPALVAVRGANGSGKSTLLRILAGLLRPTSGQARMHVEGRDVPTLERHRWLGYAGPELAFYPELTTAENLEFAAETRGLTTPRARAQAALDRVGLMARGSDRVSALSSGMVQRLRLAFALMAEAPLLLLDEPGSHLDDDGRTMLDAVVDRERGLRLVVLATNDQREGSRADRTLELRGGGVGHPA